MKERKRIKGKKGRMLSSAAALIAAAAAAFLLFSVLSPPISGNTKKLMSDTAIDLEDSLSAAVKEAFPISRDTEKLLSASIMVLQNPDYLQSLDDSFRSVSIEIDDQKKIVHTIEEEWPEDTPPWSFGYAGMCENWVCDVYKEAGLPSSGSCCAAGSRDRLARVTDRIPVGAMIYSGDEYSSGKICEICGRDPGHVAIYLGDGKVAGSQSQYIMTLIEFMDMFGYGGWSFSGNTYG